MLYTYVIYIYIYIKENENSKIENRNKILHILRIMQNPFFLYEASQGSQYFYSVNVRKI